MNLRIIIREEMDDFNWIKDTNVIRRGVSYKFNPPLSFKGYKKLLKIISIADDGVIIPIHSLSTGLKNRIHHKLNGDIKFVTISKDGNFYISFNEKPKLTHIEGDKFVMNFTDRYDDYNTIELYMDNPKDQQIIKDLQLPIVDGRKIFNL